MRKKILLSAGAFLLLACFALAALLYNLLHRVEGDYFDSNGVRIHYTDQGKGLPVILIHGYTANADLNWRLPGILTALQDKFRVIALDARGHGLSDKPHDPSAYGVEMVHDVARLMDHLKIEKAHVIGYSMGGFITLKFVTMYPGRVISAMPCGAAWMTPGDPLCDLANQIHAGLVRKDSPAGFLSGMRTRIQLRVLSMVMDLPALGGVAAGFKELAIPEEAIRAIKVPVRAVKGAEEELVLGGGDLKATLPGYEEVLVPGGRHNTVIFYPDFLGALMSFLIENSQTSPDAA